MRKLSHDWNNPKLTKTRLINEFTPTQHLNIERRSETCQRSG